MTENNFIDCKFGEFFLPAALYAVLTEKCRHGSLYFRQDDDVLTISPVPITGARRRELRQQYKSSLFGKVTRLAIIDFDDSVRLMPVAWRVDRRKQQI